MKHKRKEYMQIRQGDLLFTKIEDDVQGLKTQQLTIAEGEFTGHHHILIAEAGSSIRGDKQKFTLTGKARLTHPEHKEIVFESGTYVVSVEREYDYIDMTLKAVQD